MEIAGNEQKVVVRPDGHQKNEAEDDVPPRQWDAEQVLPDQHRHAERPGEGERHCPDDYQGRDKHGHYDNDQDAFNGVRCVDSPAPTDAATWVSADQQIRQVAPFLSYGQFTGNAPRDLCALWPVPATSAPHTTAPVAPGKVVVVSTTHDPATPYQAGVSLARQLGAPLITFDGTQHTAVFGGNQCVDNAVVTYFVAGTVPPASLNCAP